MSVRGYVCVACAGTGRRGTLLRGCPPACGLLLYAASQSATPSCALASLVFAAAQQPRWLEMTVGQMVQRGLGVLPN